MIRCLRVDSSESSSRRVYAAEVAVIIYPWQLTSGQQCLEVRRHCNYKAWRHRIILIVIKVESGVPWVVRMGIRNPPPGSSKCKFSACKQVPRDKCLPDYQDRK
jgi:hypothetical protein